MDMFGVKILAFILLASVDKFGLDQNAHAHRVLITTEQCAFNVSMDKNGILKLKAVLVNQAIDGMDNSAKNLFHAPMEESGMLIINNVFVLMEHIGVDITV